MNLNIDLLYFEKFSGLFVPCILHFLCDEVLVKVLEEEKKESFNVYQNIVHNMIF